MILCQNKWSTYLSRHFSSRGLLAYQGPVFSIHNNYKRSASLVSLVTKLSQTEVQMQCLKWEWFCETGNKFVMATMMLATLIMIFVSPVMQLLVPSMGSKTQRYSLPASLASIHCSSSKMQCSSTSYDKISRMAFSASLSAIVTSGSSGLESVSTFVLHLAFLKGWIMKI